MRSFIKGVDILGTRYTVVEEDLKEDYRLKENLGYVDPTTKRIVICNFDRNENDIDVGSIDKLKKQVLRHEVIHAFLIESGLNSECSWHTEEMVDWLALQLPKINRVIKEMEVE